MNTSKIRLLAVWLLAMLAFNTAIANLNPAHYLNPAICFAPVAPALGQPGYGPTNAFGNGIYWDPNTGMWFIPEGLYNDSSDTDRDIALIEASLPPPARPEWAIFDMESDGTYYFMGGYYNGHYYGAGYYLPYEIS